MIMVIRIVVSVVVGGSLGWPSERVAAAIHAVGGLVIITNATGSGSRTIALKLEVVSVKIIVFYKQLLISIAMWRLCCSE